VIASLDRRVIVQELLDTLPTDDTRAVASRRDLVWINALMFQSRIMASLLRRHVAKPPRRILELGCGDGSFMLAVARRMGNTWRGVELVMVDQADLLPASRRDSFAALGWHARSIKSDMFEWLAKPEHGEFDVVCANLVLHHFSDEALAGLFKSVQKLTTVLIATEPRRSALAMAGCSMLRLIGVNVVTRHDAAASVRAGFNATELTALWPCTDGTRFEEGMVGPFTHAFAMERMR